MKYFQKILTIGVILMMTIVTTPRLYSQSNRAESRTEVTYTKSSKLFNEGGYVKGITPARAIGLVELLLGLLSIVFAARSKKSYSGLIAKTALVLGLLAILSSIVHLITASGAVFGSGSGKAGSILALALGLIGCIIAKPNLRSHKSR